MQRMTHPWALLLVLAACAAGPCRAEAPPAAQEPAVALAAPQPAAAHADAEAPASASTPGSAPSLAPATAAARAATPSLGARLLQHGRAAWQHGRASWYASHFHGRRTASGERYDRRALTAAHPTLPIASYVRVRNPANGREVVVRINDRGPFRSGHVIDVSHAAATLLGILRGPREVEIEPIGDARRHPAAEHDAS
jgi:rare lipoprotein A